MPGVGTEINAAEDKRQYIRIFKDEVSKELWDSYCMGLGINDSDKIKSFRIYINSQSDVQVDSANEENFFFFVGNIM